MNLYQRFLRVKEVQEPSAQPYVGHMKSGIANHLLEHRLVSPAMLATIRKALLFPFMTMAYRVAM